MMFKFGVTVTIFVAVYMYFAINYLTENDDEDAVKSIVIVDKDGVSVVKKVSSAQYGNIDTDHSMANE